MKKKMALLLLSFSIVTSAPVNAITLQEAYDEQAYTNSQLDYIYTQLDGLSVQKANLDAEIAIIGSDLVNLIASIDILQQEIETKNADIEKVQTNLKTAKTAKNKQYETMKKRIQYLYEKGGDYGWLVMALDGKNLADILTRVEYTQALYKQDRNKLVTFSNTIKEIKNLETQYLEEQSALQEMKDSFVLQQNQLETLLEEKKAQSSNYQDEISYAYYLAGEYEAILVQQTNLIDEIEYEIYLEEIAAAEAEAAEAEYEEYYGDETAEYEPVVDEDGDPIYNDEGQQLMKEVDSDAPSVIETDEYGNVIDDSNGTYEAGSSGSSIVDYATQFVGNPYVWGGTSLTNGADCSGFVQSVYKNFGYDLPRTSYEQQEVGREVSYSEAQPGDLICYGGHVAIYMGDGKIVHASNSRDGIKISDDATYRTILSVRRFE